MITENSIREILVSIKLIDVDIEIYTKAFLSMWELVKPAYSSSLITAHGEEHILTVLKKSMQLVRWLKFHKKSFDCNKESKYILSLGLATFLHDVYSESHRDTHHILAHNLVLKIRELAIDIQKHDANMGHESLYYSMLNIVTDIDPRGVAIGLIPDETLLSKFKWLNLFTKYDLDNVANMVFEHRASVTKCYSNKLCETFAVADKDELDIKKIVRRCYNHTIAIKSKDRKEIKPSDLTVKQIVHGGIVISTVNIVSKLLINKEYILVEVYIHILNKYSRDGYMFENVRQDSLYYKYYGHQLEDFWFDVNKILVTPKLITEYIK